jgi:hypothetical protein
MTQTKGKFGIVVAIMVITAIAFSCAASRPGWYLNPPEDDDTFYGTGASEPTELQSLGKQVADAAARTDLANSITVSVQSMVRSFLQQSGDIENARALQFSEAVSKQVTDVTLTGSRITKRSEANNVYYSLAEVSVESVRNALLSAMQNAAAEFSEMKAEQALEDLNEEIEKGRIPIIRQ